MKPLKYCANGDGNPVCPPSKVICKDCMRKVRESMEKMIKEMRGQKKKGERNNGNKLQDV